MKKIDRYLVANFGEIFLKGGNISFFEQKLYKNFLNKIGDLKEKIIFEKKAGGSFFIRLKEEITDEEIEKLKNKIKTTPGFVNYYLAYVCPSKIDEIKETASFLAQEEFKKRNKEIKTFGVATEKVDKIKDLKTQDLNIKVGSAVWKILNKDEEVIKVDLNNPDLKIHLKVRSEKTLIYSKIEKAVGGLPVGSAGRAVAMFSGGIDSPVAAYLAMKRGLEITAVHFHSVPQTSPQSIEKVKRLVQVLAKYQGKIKLYLIPIIPLQKDIVAKAERKLSIVLQRRAFLRLGNMVAEREKVGEKIRALITGDSLGQVASQTLENMIAVSEILNNEEKIILRPLVTYDKTEIISLADKIGTLEISQEPHDDACSLFVPKRPETRANLKKVLEEEEKLDSKILDEVLSRAEILEFK